MQAGHLQSSSTGLLSSYENIYWIVGGLFKKGDNLKLEKKHFENITAYIIGLNKNYFVKQFKNKIKFKYSKHLKKAILTLKNDLKKDQNSKTILFMIG